MFCGYYLGYSVHITSKCSFLSRRLREVANIGLRNINLQKPINSPVSISTIKKYSGFPDQLQSFEVLDSSFEEKQTKLTIVNEVNSIIATNKEGRLFAVVYVAGKEFKVTSGDVIVIEGYWPPDVGDKIILDKVLLAGASDFTLIGRPLIQKNLVKVEATVIEKTLSHTKTHFRKKRRKQYMRINFYRIPQTYLRINDVRIEGELNNPPDVRGLETVIF